MRQNKQHALARKRSGLHPQRWKFASGFEGIPPIFLLDDRVPPAQGAW